MSDYNNDDFDFDLDDEEQKKKEEAEKKPEGSAFLRDIKSGKATDLEKTSWQSFEYDLLYALMYNDSFRRALIQWDKRTSYLMLKDRNNLEKPTALFKSVQRTLPYNIDFNNRYGESLKNVHGINRFWNHMYKHVFIELSAEFKSLYPPPPLVLPIKDVPIKAVNKWLFPMAAKGAKEFFTALSHSRLRTELGDLGREYISFTKSLARNILRTDTLKLEEITRIKQEQEER